MRILQIRFKNLNSLWGEWKIDFTHPAYASDGIFAITGPTGAGKTTILDAICLALYGRTPRLKDVTQSTNEVMSRQAGECFAEVLFEAGNGKERYCVHWEQHRAHKKPDGPLQPPRHEIADAATGKILETKQKEVDLKVEEVTGLTFDRFVRSMLLAQGSFATFLQSGVNERAPVLEQITGTEIYSRISVRTHEIRNAERSKLNALEAGLSGLQTVTPEEKEQIETELAAQLQEENALEERFGLHRKELEWLEAMTTLQKELDILEDRDGELLGREEGFESERKRLERAQRALEFGSAHSALLAIRREQDAEKHALLDLQAKLPELEADVRRSEETLQLTLSALTEKQTEQKNALDLLRKVRELDFRQNEKAPLVQEAQNTWEQLKKLVKGLREKYENAQADFEKSQLRLRDARKYLRNNMVDERLVEQLAGIRTRFETLGAGLEKRRRLFEEYAKTESLKQQAHSTWNEQSASYETAKVKYTAGESLVQKLKNEFSETLNARPLSDWREKLDGLVERRQREKQIEELLNRQLEATGVLDDLKSRASMLLSTQRTCQTRIVTQQARILELENNVRQFETQMVLIRRIQDLEESRMQLHDGEPCPLCGSTTHPYAEGNIPKEDEVQSSLSFARQELREAGEALRDLQIQNAQCAQELLQNREEETRRQAELEHLEAALAEGMAVLQLKLPMGVPPLTGIGRQRQKTEELLQKTRLTVERAEQIEAALQNAREDLEKLRADLEEMARLRQEAEFKRESAGREWSRLAQEIRIHDEELKTVRFDLTNQIMPYGYKNLPDEQPSQILEQLEARLQKWQEYHRLSQDLEKQIAAEDRDLHHLHDDLEKRNLEQKDREDVVKKLRAERDALQQQRTGLFGERNPDEEEAAQAASVLAAQKLVEEKRAAREVVLQEFATMHSRLEDLGKTIHIRTHTLQKTDIAFNRQLVANDFRDEDAYLAACLPEEERRKLQDRTQSLFAERTELDARRTDRKFALEELRRRQLTDRSAEELRATLAEISERRKELQQSVGALRQRLDAAANSDRLQEERRIALDRQKQEYLRWEKLHELIGSADGQKYRNFVQGLTFELMIRYANRQLQKMTDRYQLIRDETQPLELKVVDSYQAGEIRSTKNLSGGESFIVSLALALGLSQMSSHKVRVDSLFLDEGFGTLDEEALDTALSTLAGLRREGKLIGVISHVEALKERIATQIEVIPQGNGRSTIHAPGCERGA